LTCQEISTMVREGVSATLFLFNNKGYTIGTY
jgi:TPP-dependent 2-oxoacid decarboxylase